jgi:tRNA-splicing ligase RtcB
MLHSGSRGIGNRIGTYFIERAKAEMERWFVTLPDPDLAYLPESSELFRSMGKRSSIVRGKGEAESFRPCSHGAGRVMSRGEAVRRFTVEDLARQTEGVECRKDLGVLDEIPGAYKDLDLVMAAQADLVEVVHTLRAVMTVKG